MISINTEVVRATNIQSLVKYLFSAEHEFEKLTEHYTLLGYLSKQYPDGSLFLDIGTRRGNSAVAMSLNPNIHVDSYDINDYNCKEQIKKDNISFHIGNLFDDLTQVLKYDLILLDIDPHSGKIETDFIAFLKDNDWKGVLILDDIGPSWKTMNEMWNNIEDLDKYDVTKIAHASGTGIIDFNNNLKVEL